MPKHTQFANGVTLDVDKRYKFISVIGQGAYGTVCSFEDTATKQHVAIKKIPSVFNNLIDAKRTLREVKILKHFDHENIIGIKDIETPTSKDDFGDVYIVSELMDTNLWRIIRSPQPLTNEHCQYFLYQILRGLKCIHSAHVVHRDLKPSNLLVNSDCSIKICDFGLSRGIYPESTDEEYTVQYVTTKWYRAPEVLLSSSNYGLAIDMWAVGCIFAELLQRKPLFPGDDNEDEHIQQLKLITDLLGTPSPTDVQLIGTEQSRKYILSLPHKPRVSFEQVLPQAMPEAIDLLRKMLVFDPNRRITVEEALEHPYLSELHDPNDEPVASETFDFSFERAPMEKEFLRELIYKEITSFHKNQMFT